MATSCVTRSAGCTAMVPSYFFKETFVGLKRNGLVAFAAISTVFIAVRL